MKNFIEFFSHKMQVAVITPNRVTIVNAEEPNNRHEYRGLVACFSHDGSKLATIDGHYVNMIPFPNFPNPPLFSLRYENNGAHNVCFSDDDSTIITAHLRDNLIILWDATTGERLNIIQLNENILPKTLTSKDGMVFISHGDHVTSYGMATGQAYVTYSIEVTRLNREIISVEVSHDGTRVIGRLDKAGTAIWDRQTGARIARVSYDRVFFSRDDIIMGKYRNGEIRNVMNRTVITRYDNEDVYHAFLSEFAIVTLRRVDGRFRIRVRELETENMITEFDFNEDRIKSILVAPIPLEQTILM
jgi:WD40 repeat protein